MKKSQRVAQRKQKREMAKERRLQKQAAVLEEKEDDLILGAEAEEEILDEISGEDEESADLDEEEEGESPEPAQKDYMGGYSPTMDVAPGPTSWDELDAMKQAQEDANAMEEVSYETRNLVRNILMSQEMEPDEKVAAMQAVADGFGNRVQAEVADETQKSVDMELLELEALIARDKRVNGNDFFMNQLKEVVSYASRKAMPDSNFALVTTFNGKKIRKYLIHDAAHVRNALARAAQQIKRGGQGATWARAALPRIKAAAKKFGIGKDTKKEASSILVQKDIRGDWRWVGISSNNFQDRDSDIVSKEAHQEFIGWWETHKELSPVFDSCHVPGTSRTFPIDFITFENGFLIESGKLTEKEAAGLFRAQREHDLGLSMGMFAFRDPKNRHIITKYRQYAITDLPLKDAANPWTELETFTKEVGMDKASKVKYLTTIFGDETKAQSFVNELEQKEAELQAAGVASKEATQPTQEKPTEPVAKETAIPVDLQVVMQQMEKQFDLPGLSKTIADLQEKAARVELLEESIKSLMKNRDQALAEQIKPAVATYSWMNKERASQSEKTAVEEDDPIAQKGPEMWLSEVTGTEPVKVQ